MMNEDYASKQARHMLQCWAAQDGYQPLEVEKTEACWIHTKDGRKVFDLRSAHECINLGFRHPKVLEAMRQHEIDFIVEALDEALLLADKEVE